ncbi:MAG TPA: Lrp/AsnC family transcriptional regulator [Candidatus Bilamarchaeaceae archaeon]|nr:Lrp/AsnC family transcriptional regulator [Candidatus Bilamarchaeaceae archaeon]
MVDEKDKLIIDELSKNSRESTVEISKKTKIPRVTVHERIKKMKENDTIKKFTIVPNYNKMELGTTAFVLISYSHNKLLQREVAEKVAKLHNVYSIFLIAGEWDMIAKVRGKNLEEIGKLVLEKMRNIEGVEKTFTMGCFETIKDDI